MTRDMKEYWAGGTWCILVFIMFSGRQFDFQRPKAQRGTGNSKTGLYL